MSSATVWDHVFSLVVFIVYPLIAWRTFPGTVRRIRAHGEPAKIAEYRWVIAAWPPLPLFSATDRSGGCI